MYGFDPSRVPAASARTVSVQGQQLQKQEQASDTEPD
jgi:hypothetical protein